MAKTLIVVGLLSATATAIRVGEEQKEIKVKANHTLEGPSQRERIDLINQRKCKSQVQCEGEIFFFDSLHCPPGAPKGVGVGNACRDCDCEGYADCLTMGMDPNGASGMYDPAIMCKQPKGTFTPWDVVNRGPIVCDGAVNGVRAESQIKRMCESDPTCWGYSILTDILYPEKHDTRYSLCKCERRTAFVCSGKYDEVKTMLRVMPEAIEFELEED